MAPLFNLRGDKKKKKTKKSLLQGNGQVPGLILVQESSDGTTVRDGDMFHLHQMSIQ
ncbi:hypothetical protein YC2023_002389 [Brassica napus]